MSDPARTESTAAPAPGTQAPLSAVDILAFVCELILILLRDGGIELAAPGEDRGGEQKQTRSD